MNPKSTPSPKGGRYMKRSFMTEEQKNLILELHKEGWSTKHIYEKVGTSKHTTYSFLRKQGLKSHNSNIVTPPMRKRIEELYLEGLTIREINSKHFPELSEGTVNNVLRKLGITRPNGIVPNLNQDYFEVIDSERKAYWLGFIVADGCVTERIGVNQTVTGKKLRVEVKKDDGYLLEELAKDLDSDKEVKYCYSERHHGNFTKPKHNAYISFGSLKLCGDLAQYGVVPRKSLITDGIPTNIPSEYVRHFIRGFFDGDGSVNIRKSYDVLACAFYGTTEMLESVQDHLIEVLGFKRRKIIKQKEANVSLYQFASQEDVLAFYNYIYQDATVFLKRKKEVFDSHRLIQNVK